MSTKNYRKILGVQVRCLQETDKQRNRPGPRGGPTRGRPPKNSLSGRYFIRDALITFKMRWFWAEKYPGAQNLAV